MGTRARTTSSEVIALRPSFSCVAKYSKIFSRELKSLCVCAIGHGSAAAFRHVPQQLALCQYLPA